MSWLSSFLAAVLTSVVAAVAGGFLASACVDWFRIPAREGEAGYFIVGIVLLAGFLGFVGGLILAKIYGGPGGAGFLKGWGVASGVMLGLAAAVALVSWILADIPPTIGGALLDLAVEIRLPKGADPPAAPNPEQHYLLLQSSSGPTQPARASQYGVLNFSKARQEDGRWILPGAVFLFTTRGTRSLLVVLDPKQGNGFELPLPGHPGARYEQWSEWLPSGRAGKPWPDTEMSYRFRVRPRPRGDQ